MRKIFYLLFALSSISTFAQQSINDYQYVVLPKKFDFLKDVDQYKLNTLSKQYLEQIGFTVFYRDEVPRELANENCNKLYFDLTENNSMFWTRLTISLKDCAGEVLYQSAEGESRDKDSKIAYVQALRQVFGLLNATNYTYSGKQLSTVLVQNPIVKESVKEQENEVKPTQTIAMNSLFAQPIANGFQLIDTTPKVVYKLQTTSKADVFIAQRDSLTGVLIKQNEIWIFEAYENGKPVRETVDVKL